MLIQFELIHDIMLYADVLYIMLLHDLHSRRVQLRLRESSKCDPEAQQRDRRRLRRRSEPGLTAADCLRSRPVRRSTKCVQCS